MSPGVLVVSIVLALLLFPVEGEATSHCPVGFELAAGSNICKPCSIGTYGDVDDDTGLSRCVVCPRGRWGDIVGGIDLSSGCNRRLDGYGFRPEEEPALYRYAADLAVGAFHCECDNKGVPIVQQGGHWTTVQLSQVTSTGNNVSASALVPPRGLLEISPWTFVLVGGHRTGFVAIVNFTRGLSGGAGSGGPSAVLNSYVRSIPDRTVYKIPSGTSVVVSSGVAQQDRQQKQQAPSPSPDTPFGESTVTYDAVCGIHEGKVDSNRDGCGTFGEVVLFSAAGASWPSAATVTKPANDLFVGYSTLPSRIVSVG